MHTNEDGLLPTLVVKLQSILVNALLPLSFNAPPPLHTEAKNSGKLHEAGVGDAYIDEDGSSMVTALLAMPGEDSSSCVGSKTTTHLCFNAPSFFSLHIDEDGSSSNIGSKK